MSFEFLTSDHEWFSRVFKLLNKKKFVDNKKQLVRTSTSL